MKPPLASRSIQKHQLRIIAGQWRGRKLAIADIPGLRPTGDRIRETLFNWLAPDIADSHCLDLFAGSGALSFECLSRGAASTTMLEKHPKAVKQLRDSLQQLKAGNATVVQQDALHWLNQTQPPSLFDIVFIDPPFEANLWKPVIEALVSRPLLARNCLIYLETPKHHAVTWPNTWSLLKEKNAGDVCYRLLQTDDG